MNKKRVHLPEISRLLLIKLRFISTIKIKIDFNYFIIKLLFCLEKKLIELNEVFHELDIYEEKKVR